MSKNENFKSIINDFYHKEFSFGFQGGKEQQGPPKTPREKINFNYFKSAPKV